MTPVDPALADQLNRIEALLERLVQEREQPREVRSSYSVAEVAEMVGRCEYVVRGWCRDGRVNATKRQERRGGAELWVITATEVLRYKNEGLLPFDRTRNA
jgi:hypothetical protein